MEAELAVMQSQTMDYLEPPKDGRGRGRFFLRVFRQSVALSTP